MTELITQKQLADMLQVTIQTICNWQKAGKLPPPVIVEATTRYDLKDIREWLEASKQPKSEVTTASK